MSKSVTPIEEHVVDETLRDSIETAVSYGLALMVVLALVGLIYLSSSTGMPAEPYTELYILGPEGQAADYPANLSTGERGEIIVGITNREHKVITYSLIISLENRTIASESVTLSNEENWEERFEFTPREPGKKQLEVLLYLNSPRNSSEPYRSVGLNVSVRDQSANNYLHSSMDTPFSRNGTV